MFHTSIVCFPFVFAFLSMTMGNPCPCESVVNDSSSNDLPNSITYSQANRLIDDERLEEYLNLLASSSQSGISSDLPSLYPFVERTKTPEANHNRLKRPSWAAIGKRAAALAQKRPSWAQVG